MIGYLANVANLVYDEKLYRFRIARAFRGREVPVSTGALDDTIPSTLFCSLQHLLNSRKSSSSDTLDLERPRSGRPAERTMAAATRSARGFTTLADPAPFPGMVKPNTESEEILIGGDAGLIRRGLSGSPNDFHLTKKRVAQGDALSTSGPNSTCSPSSGPQPQTPRAIPEHSPHHRVDQTSHFPRHRWLPWQLDKGNC